MSKKKEAGAVMEPASETKMFEVKLECPTPLAFNPAIVEAMSAEEAWSVFCGMNGISGSDHSRTITAS